MTVRRELLMPKLGLTMTEGLVADWLVRPGQSFEAGDAVFIVETDKVANEIPAEASGVLNEIVVPVGQNAPVGAVIGYWDDGGAGAAVVAPAAKQAASAPQTANKPEERPAAQATPRNTAADPTPASRIVASPLARRLASQRGITLASLRGTGPKGRIVARDIPQQAPSEPAPATPEHQLIAPTALQSTIARRLTQGKQETPHFYLAREAEVSRLVALRREINGDGKDDGGALGLPRLTLNHFIVMAVARAMRLLPSANRVWTQDGILAFGRVDVGVAVGTEHGLLAPAVCDVGDLSIGELARRLDAVAARARDNALLPRDMGNPAITVSNAGMHNVTYMTSIINPGQAMILGVGSIREVFRPDAAGQPALRHEMGLVLSADHRILDCVSALQFLDAVVSLLERPARLLAT